MQTLVSEKAFYDARFLVMGELATRIRGAGGIGTQSEKMLHSILKYSIEPNDNFHEIKRYGSVVDILREDEIYEMDPITETNFFNYIYGSGEATDWTGTDNYDGCTCLSAKPE